MPEDGTKGIGTLAETLRKVPAVSARMPDVGEVFAGRYDLQRLLGRGGMGVVYLANQAPLGRQVALKILKPPESIEDDPNFDERFLREAAAAAQLSHPNTITVHDFGQADDGALYIVMEYLEGSDVRTVLTHEGALSPARAIHIAKQVCKSLREAHRKGIIHRDLKPANVLLLERDEDADFVKVLDFGLVKFRGEASEITLAGKFLGSPRYTSPEALDRTKEVDHRADIYATGVLLYTMITGQPPFNGDPMQVLHAHLHEKPKPMWHLNPEAQTSPDLEGLVAKCLEKDPDKRYQSMSDLALALHAVDASFSHEDTETLDLEVNESLELDPDPSSVTGAKISRPTERPATTPGPTSVRREEPRRKRRQVRPPLLPALLGIAGVLVVMIVLLLLRGHPSPSLKPAKTDPLTPPQPEEIEVGANRVVQLQVTTEPEGAGVSVQVDGSWQQLGLAPLSEMEIAIPEGVDALPVRLNLEGHRTVEMSVAIAQGAARLSGVLEPLETAHSVAPAPVELPPTAPLRPEPVVRPEPTPAPKPKPEPTTPKAEPVPSGYKDNPY